MAAWAKAAKAAMMASLRGCKTQPLEAFQLQTTRGMGGHGHSHGPPKVYRSYDGKPPPSEMQSDAYITYAGLTLIKPPKGIDYYYTKLFGGLVWFTMLYHGYMNWGEHWDGDIWTFEADVQRNGWDDENGHGHGHGHGHH